MEDKLLVFISSVMNLSVEDLRAERWVAKKAIDDIPMAKPWLFEYSPASSQEATEVYRQKVKHCDIFIAILGTKITPAVKEEYQIASTPPKKPRLVFLKSYEREKENNTHRSKDLKILLKQIKQEVKCKEYANLDELYAGIQEAVFDGSIHSFREKELKKPEIVTLGNPGSRKPIRRNTRRRTRPITNTCRRILLIGGGDLAQEIIPNMRENSDYNAFFGVVDPHQNPPALAVLRRDPEELEEPLYVVEGPWTKGEKERELRRCIRDFKPEIIIPELCATPPGFYDNLGQPYDTIIPTNKIETLINRVKFKLDFQNTYNANSDFRDKLTELKMNPPKFVICHKNNEEEIEKNAREMLPCMIKPAITEFGLGQSRVGKIEDLPRAISHLRKAKNQEESQIVIEKSITCEAEIFQIIAVRLVKNKPKIVFYPPIEYKRACKTKDRDFSIGGPWYLDYALHPALTRLPPERQNDILNRCEAIANLIWRHFLLTPGFFGIEYFIAGDDSIYLNEIALRPDDMGFVTLRSQSASEFEVFSKVVLKKFLPEIDEKPHHAIVRSVVWSDDKGKYEWAIKNKEKIENKYHVRIYPLPKTDLYPGQRIGRLRAEGQDISKLLENSQKAIEELQFRVVEKT